MELIADLLPAGVLDVVNGRDSLLGRSLVEHDGVGKVAFTGSTVTGRQIMQYAIKKIIPSTMELGGKSEEEGVTPTRVSQPPPDGCLSVSRATSRTTGTG